MLALWYAAGFCERWVQMMGYEVTRFFVVAFVVSFQVLIICWFTLDAQEHHRQLSKALYLPFFPLNLLAILVHFLETRGGKALRPIFLALLFFGFCLLCNRTGYAVSPLLPNIIKRVLTGSG